MSKMIHAAADPIRITARFGPWSPEATLPIGRWETEKSAMTLAPSSPEQNSAVLFASGHAFFKPWPARDLHNLLRPGQAMWGLSLKARGRWESAERPPFRTVQCAAKLKFERRRGVRVGYYLWMLSVIASQLSHDSSGNRDSFKTLVARRKSL